MARTSVAMDEPFAGHEEEFAVLSGDMPGRKTYFILASAINLVKIGSSDDPVRRFTELRLISPTPLDVIGVVPGGVYPERELHAKYAALRCHGEWFCATPELRRDIRGMVFCTIFGVMASAARRMNDVLTIKEQVAVFGPRLFLMAERMLGERGGDGFRFASIGVRPRAGSSPDDRW